jgi:hypothetical protein
MKESKDEFPSDKHKFSVPDIKCFVPFCHNRLKKKILIPVYVHMKQYEKLPTIETGEDSSVQFTS